MEIKEIADLGIEGAIVILLCVVSYKIYKMKSTCDSSCFKDKDNGIEFHTQNSGVSNTV
tara:strand:+ start:174 stop:350 length:177 start_codon:yes stop_codon:yes gene_type:complete